MELGIRSIIYTRNHDRAEAARLIREAGFVGVQVSSTYSDLPDQSSAHPMMGPGTFGAEIAAETTEIFHAAGLGTWVLDCYNDLSNADDEARARSITQMCAGIEIAKAFGCDAVATEAGRRGVNGFERFVDSLRQVMPTAEAEGVKVCIECSYAQSVPSVWTLAGAIDEVGSPNLGVLLDPANILCYDSVERMFSVLSDRIWYTHAKDCNVDEKGMPSFPSAGQGQVDWHRFVELMGEHGVTKLIVEYANEETAPEVHEFLCGIVADVEGS